MKESRRRVYRANGIEIDADLGQIRKNGGGPTYLRRKAHRLLMCLIEHRSAPVPKEELVRLVWEGAAITDDTLVNCVQEIRKALGDDARSPVFIRTMPKTGYWFIAPVEEEIVPAGQMNAGADVAPAVKESEGVDAVEVAPVVELGPVQVPSRPKWNLWGILALAAVVAITAAWKFRPSPRQPTM
ncbi:MAG: winged helix-turn-helix domain-containing protein, partial [Bryobacteraceae bacterium]